MNDRALNILLVEDDRVDRMNVERALKESRVSNPIYTAVHGEDALEKLRGGEVPLHRLLVLLDLNMPKMNGIEFLQEIRKDDDLRHLPVVILTTSDSERDRIEAYELNVAGYIVKPVTFMSFVDAMATLNKYWMLVELP